MGFDPWITQNSSEDMNNDNMGLNDCNKFFNIYPLKIISSNKETPANKIIDKRIFSKSNIALSKTICPTIIKKEKAKPIIANPKKIPKLSSVNLPFTSKPIFKKFSLSMYFIKK